MYDVALYKFGIDLDLTMKFPCFWHYLDYAVVDLHCVCDSVSDVRRAGMHSNLHHIHNIYKLQIDS